VVSPVPSCIPLGALIALVNHHGRSNTRWWCPFHSMPCQYDLTCDFVYPSCPIIQENIIFNSANYRSSLEFEKVIFYSKHPLKLMNREDRVMKCDTSRFMEYNLILQDIMSSMHGRKIDIDNWYILLLATISIPFLRHAQCIFHHFFYPPPPHPSFINLRMRFFLRGEGSNTPCHQNPNPSHQDLN
jgi:hypothetical protein